MGSESFVQCSSPASRPCVFSEWDSGLCVAVNHRNPSEIAFHARCLHHLDGNVIRKLEGLLGALLQPFREAFWRVYYAFSPEAFELAWRQLLLDYPTASPYLESELWPCRERWAFAYVSRPFTCGVRTSGRVESENRINKLVGDSKTPLIDLVNN